MKQRVGLSLGHGHRECADFLKCFKHFITDHSKSHRTCFLVDTVICTDMEKGKEDSEAAFVPTQNVLHSNGRESKLL